MCLIAHRAPRQGNIPNRVIEFNRRSNPDGFGIAWRDGETLRFQKFAPSAVDAFEAKLKEIDRDQDIEYVAHWRKATHGPVTEEFAHPFPYEDVKDGQVLVFHNGIVSNNPPKDQSDTSYFVQTILSRLQPRWWSDKSHRWLIEESTGWSRFLIMTKHEIVRLNQNAWQRQNGIWYSTNPVPGYAPQKGGGYQPPSKSASESATVLYGLSGRSDWFDDDADLDVDEYDDDDGTEADACGYNPSRRTQTVYGDRDENGHWVSFDTFEDDLGDGDVHGAAHCITCKGLGEYYIIDGKIFIDAPHIDNGGKIVQNVNQTALLPLN